MPTLHLLIKGKVQGVFYRATAKKAAVALNLTGWIKNNDNGDVEALVTGDAQQLKQFVANCRREPAGAEVREIIETELEEVLFTAFVIKR